MDDLAITEPTIFNSKHPDLARVFLGWLQQNLRNGKIKTNRRNAMVHIVTEGVFLLSPKIFKAFVNDYDALRGDDFAVKRTQNKLTNLLKKNKILMRTADGRNIHTYFVRNSSRIKKMHGWLLPLLVVYQDIPTSAINTALINGTGIWVPGKKTKINKQKKSNEYKDYKKN